MDLNVHFDRLIVFKDFKTGHAVKILLKHRVHDYQRLTAQTVGIFFRFVFTFKIMRYVVRHEERINSEVRKVSRVLSVFWLVRIRI